MARLPNPGADEGQWGTILNDYLGQSLDAAGVIKTGAVSSSQLQDGAVTAPKLSASGALNGQVLTYSGGSLSWTTVAGGSIPDADSTTKGIIQLTGALGGTAASPTVPGLAAKENTITAGTTGQYYRGDKSWQTLDKSAVGLANADNTSDANKPISSATQTALNSKENTITTGTTGQYYRGDKSWQTLDKSAVGLANVDNTSDANKPVSSATQTALNAKAATATTVTGATSLTGGGDLSANRTLSLVNDAASPGNNKYYGTDGSGVKGFHDVPSGGGATIVINAQTGTTYGLVLADAGKLVTLTNAAAITLNVPDNASQAFPIGTNIMFAQMGVGQVTFVAAGGVAVFGDPGLKIAAQYGAAELIKTATDTWLLVGRLAA